MHFLLMLELFLWEEGFLLTIISMGWVGQIQLANLPMTGLGFRDEDCVDYMDNAIRAFNISYDNL